MALSFCRLSDRGVGRIGKGKQQIAFGVPNDVITIIDARAEALGWTRSRFASEVLLRWHEQGCPPITEADRLMQIAKGAGKAKKTAGAA